jgi:3-hydroxyacyl-[acyl-carrier-protein] dehydratase
MAINTKKDTPKELSYKEVMKILPHRYPFLMVDKVIEVNLDEKVIIGQKNTTINEMFFQGHFPNMPIMPGVLILEALAQTGGIYINLKGYNQLCALLNINNAKFRRPVTPGDILTLHVTEKHLSGKGGKFQGRAFVDEKLVAEAEIGCVLIEKTTI